LNFDNSDNRSYSRDTLEKRFNPYLTRKILEELSGNLSKLVQQCVSNDLTPKDTKFTNCLSRVEHLGSSSLYEIGKIPGIRSNSKEIKKRILDLVEARCVEITEKNENGDPKKVSITKHGLNALFTLYTLSKLLDSDSN